MKNNDYWERFFQTGAILDYLNYTACTSELADQNIDENTGSNEEGGVNGGSKSNRNGPLYNANRRL